MMIIDFLERPDEIPLIYKMDTLSERKFVVADDLFITLSDGYELHIEKGFETDLSSVPELLWSLMTPIDHGFIGDLIHDKLWTEKQNQFEHFGWNIYKARKFADDERLKWRKKMVPEKILKNYITHAVIRLVGGFFYSRQLNIPQ